MGSSKKNSKSKAATQSAECVAVCDVELKVAESEVNAETDVNASPPSRAEDPSPVEVLTPAEEPSPADAVVAETPVDEAPSSIETNASAEKTTDTKDTVAAESSLFEQPAEKQVANTSLAPSAIPLSLKPEMSTEWPFTRKRQVFNVFYFGLISFQLLALTKSGVAPGAAYFCLALCGFLTTASVFYLFNHRHHQTSSEDFSPRVRRSLRAVGLLVPAFLMFALARTEPPVIDAKTAVEEMGIPPLPLSPMAGNFASEMAQGKRDFKRHRFESALNHFERAVSLDPSSDVAFAWVAESNDSMMRFTPALNAALRAMDLNPDNEQAHVVAAHYYNITQQYDKARDYAERAIALNPEDGEAYGYASAAYNGLGNFEKALTYDNGHVKWHYYEARAFEQRAQTLERLGRHNEADYTREIAKKVREVGVR